MTRTRGIMVSPLAPEVYDSATIGIDRYARAVNPNTDEVFLIHYEGVSYPVTDDKPWRFNDYVSDAPTYTPAQVLEFPVTEDVDLADWIRTFGARLDNNHALAVWALTTKGRL